MYPPASRSVRVDTFPGKKNNLHLQRLRRQLAARESDWSSFCCRPITPR